MIQIVGRDAQTVALDGYYIKQQGFDMAFIFAAASVRAPQVSQVRYGPD